MDSVQVAARDLVNM